jgi:hypothetical protein
MGGIPMAWVTHMIQSPSMRRNTNGLGHAHNSLAADEAEQALLLRLLQEVERRNVLRVDKADEFFCTAISE